MTTAISKSSTDLHWHQRAAAVAQTRDVNIQDVFQRELEYDFICPQLDAANRILEVGCGNGYSTNVFRKFAGHVDGFDQSENMIERAKATYGETNNRFLVDNVLSPSAAIKGPYDVVVCVRVLINLRDFAEQICAVRNLAKAVKPGGTFILVEGYTDGFNALNDLRALVDLPPVVPAKINYYCGLDEMLPVLRPNFDIVAEYHLGNYDYLTRVVYPLMVGPEQVTHNTELHEKLQMLSKIYNPDELKPLSRIRGFVLRQRGA